MLRRALKARPQFPEAMNNLASIMQQQGNAAEALTMLQQSLAMRPQFPEALINQGNALHTLCRYAAATSVSLVLPALQPGNYTGWSNFSIVLLELDETEAAIAAAMRDFAEAGLRQRLPEPRLRAEKIRAGVDEAAEAF